MFAGEFYISHKMVMPILNDSCQINLTGLSEAVSLINLSETSWPILFANEAWASHVSTQTESNVGFWDLFKVR